MNDPTDYDDHELIGELIDIDDAIEWSESELAPFKEEWNKQQEQDNQWGS